MSMIRRFVPCVRLRAVVGRAAFAAGLLILAACGSSQNVSQAERATAPTPIAAPIDVSASGQALTLTVVDGGQATGLVMTDYRGFAVYGLADETGNGAPLCVDECLNVWLPVVPRDLAVANALDFNLFAVVTRPDGIQQATYSDVPLYTWSGDSEIGITGGAGVAGTWFALTETAGFIASP